MARAARAKEKLVRKALKSKEIHPSIYSSEERAQRRALVDEALKDMAPRQKEIKKKKVSKEKVDIFSDEYIDAWMAKRKQEDDDRQSKSSSENRSHLQNVKHRIQVTNLKVKELFKDFKPYVGPYERKLSPFKKGEPEYLPENKFTDLDISNWELFFEALECSQQDVDTLNTDRPINKFNYDNVPDYKKILDAAFNNYANTIEDERLWTKDCAAEYKVGKIRMGDWLLCSNEKFDIDDIRTFISLLTPDQRKALIKRAAKKANDPDFNDDVGFAIPDEKQDFRLFNDKARYYYFWKYRNIQEIEMRRAPQIDPDLYSRYLLIFLAAIDFMKVMKQYRDYSPNAIRDQTVFIEETMRHKAFRMMNASENELREESKRVSDIRKEIYEAPLTKPKLTYDETRELVLLQRTISDWSYDYPQEFIPSEMQDRYNFLLELDSEESGLDDLSPKIRRYCSEKIIRRRLRREIERCAMQISNILGLVGGKEEGAHVAVYVPFETLTRYRQRQEISKRWLSTMINVNPITFDPIVDPLTKKIMTTKDLADKAAEAKRAALITLGKGIITACINKGKNIKVVMRTITLESKYHPNPAIGSGKSYDPTLTLTDQATRLREGANRVSSSLKRRKLSSVGFYCAEPQKDSTIHRHYITAEEADQIDAITETWKSEFPGQYQIKTEIVDENIDKAIGYVTSYILKTISNPGLDPAKMKAQKNDPLADDETAHEQDRHFENQDAYNAWASVAGVRRFGFIGVQRGTRGVWQNLHRANTMHENLKNETKSDFRVTDPATLAIFEQLNNEQYDEVISDIKAIITYQMIEDDKGKVRRVKIPSLYRSLNIERLTEYGDTYLQSKGIINKLSGASILTKKEWATMKLADFLEQHPNLAQFANQNEPTDEEPAIIRDNEIIDDDHNDDGKCVLINLRALKAGASPASSTLRITIKRDMEAEAIAEADDLERKNAVKNIKRTDEHWKQLEDSLTEGKEFWDGVEKYKKGEESKSEHGKIRPEWQKAGPSPVQKVINNKSFDERRAEWLEQKRKRHAKNKEFLDKRRAAKIYNQDNKAKYEPLGAGDVEYDYYRDEQRHNNAAVAA